MASTRKARQPTSARARFSEAVCRLCAGCRRGSEQGRVGYASAGSDMPVPEPSRRTSPNYPRYFLRFLNVRTEEGEEGGGRGGGEREGERDRQRGRERERHR